MFTPVLVMMDTPAVRSKSAFMGISALRISAAARTARSASSSCSVGTPNTAITASPMYFSTVPPWRSSTTRISSKNRVIIRRTASGSRSSPIGVEPTTSQKTMVTVFLAGPKACASASGAAHDMQNLAVEGLAEPHAAQTGMPGV